MVCVSKKNYPRVYLMLSNFQNELKNKEQEHMLKSKQNFLELIFSFPRVSCFVTQQQKEQ